MKKFLSWSLLLCSVTGYAGILKGPEAKNINPQAIEVRTDDRDGSILFLGFDGSSPVPSTGNADQLNTLLKGSNDDSWQFMRTDRDELGFSHSRYHQLFRQVPVETGEYILHISGGQLVSMNGKFFPGIHAVTTPSIAEQQAASLAIASVGANEYLWQKPLREQQILTGSDNGYAYPKGQLVILPPGINGTKSIAELAWKYDIYATKPHQRFAVYISAITGKVLYKEDRICTIAVTGTGSTKYSGTQTFITDSTSASSYRLRDATRSSGVETYNLQSGTNYSGAVDFIDSDNNWTSTLNQDNAALDAHWGAEKTYDYYLNIHGRNSYDNLGSVIRSYVHYSSAYNNAFWNGSVMSYGDGDGSTFSPLTELDICGHELSHGVTQFSSALIYSNESGALNESFSDIFGVSIDFNSKPATANWLIGDQSYTPSTAGDALRYMNNPNQGNQPDTYLGTLWYTGTGDNGGVHTNSGVQNFWYYLLSVGGSGTNDKGFAYSVSGITINKARLIAYRCNTFYLTSGSQYADAAYYSIKAASDLYGNCSAEALSTKNAWEAVGLTGFYLNANAKVSLAFTPCTGNDIQFSATGGTTFQWSGPNSFSSTLQNPVINSASSLNNGTYRCIITTATGCTGKDSLKVTVATPPTVSVSGSATICAGGSSQLTASAAAAGQGQNAGSNSNAFAIPDNTPAGIQSPIVINGSTLANAVVSVTIDSLIHTWDADLQFILIAPNGSSITLASGVGSSGDNFIRTVYTSTAVTPIASGTAPFTGSYLPSQSFSGLTGSANGTWILKVADVGAADLGTLYKWSIQLPANTITGYNWSPSATLNNSFIYNPVATPSSTTTYTVVVNDSQGCTASANGTITVNHIDFTPSITHVSCNGGTTGAVELTISGGSSPYQVNWSNGATGSAQSNLAAGTYSFTITDAAGCSTNGSVTVNEPQQLLVMLTKTDPGCGQTNGSITASPSGGTTPYSYLWSNSSTSSVNNNLAAGTYTITVTDQNGCTAGASVQLISSGSLPGIPSSISGPKTAVCGGSSYSYSTTIVSGATSYQWTPPAGATVTNGQGSRNVTVLFPAGFLSGSLAVAAVNTCGQGSARTTTLKSIPGLTGSVTGPVANLCGSTNVTYSVPSTVSGATSYTWTTPSFANIVNGQGTISILVNFQQVAGTAGQVCVTANNACGSSAARCRTGITTAPAKPTAISGASSVCANQSGVSYSTGLQSGVNYTWTVPAGAVISSGQGTQQIAVNYGTSAGYVRVKATNNCGTSSTTSLLVSMPCRVDDVQAFSVELSPNPSDGNASLLINGYTDRYTVEISNVLGQQLFKGAGSESHFNLPSQQFKPGLYLVKVSSGSYQNVLRMVIE